MVTIPDIHCFLISKPINNQPLWETLIPLEPNLPLMELWHGPITDFIREAESGSLSGTMLKQFWNHHAYLPSESETKSWDNSLRFLSEAADSCELRDVGVVLEYHLPYSGYRIDALFFGKNKENNNASSVIELKQWSAS